MERMKIKINEIPADFEEIEKAIESAVNPLGFEFVSSGAGPKVGMDMAFDRSHRHDTCSK